MNCYSAGWVTVSFDIIAGMAIFLSLYVMQKTEHDKINSVDPQWLQRLRRLGFIVMAMTLCTGILGGASQTSLFYVFISGVLSLAINALALNLRSKPNGENGHGMKVDQGGDWQQSSTSMQTQFQRRKG
jgi:hypothetical protein